MTEIGEPPQFENGEIMTVAQAYMPNQLLVEHLDVLKEKFLNLGQTIDKIETNSSLKNERDLEFLSGNTQSDALIGILFKNSKRFRMYESIPKLINELKQFQNFSQSHKYFVMNVTNHYFTTPIVHFSLKREKFVCKTDLFVILQYLMFQNVPASKTRINCALTSIYLKSQEDTLGCKTEFVRYNPDEFDQIQMEMLKFKWTFIDENGELQSDFLKKETLETVKINFSKLSFVEVMEKFKKLIPFTWRSEELEMIQNELEKLDKNENKWTENLVCSYTNASFIIKSLQEIIKKRPDMFMSRMKISKIKDEEKSENSENSDDSSENSSKVSPPTIRVFEDGPQKFVMKDELMVAIGHTCNCKKMKVKKMIENILAKPKGLCCEYDIETIHGVPLEEVYRKNKDDIQEIEFIRFPIQRTKRRAVPIGSPDTYQFYVLAPDALLDLFKSMIWGIRIFQKFPIKRKKELYELFADLGCLLKPHMDQPYFIQQKRLEDVILLCVKKCAFHSKTPQKDVRDVAMDGFTVDDLKEELKYLDLIDFLPDITDHAENVFSEIDRVKEEKVLRTCDMFDAVENCQLICILGLFPKMKHFFHAQKSCHRILGLQCDTCQEFRKSTSSPNSEDPPTEDLSIIQNPVEFKDPIVPEDWIPVKPTAIGHEVSCDIEIRVEMVKQSPQSIPINSTSSDNNKRIRTEFGTQTENNDLYLAEKEFDTIRNQVKKLDKKIGEIKISNGENMEKMRKELKKKQEENENLKRNLKTHETVLKSNEKFEWKIGRMNIDLHEKQKEIEELRRELSTHANKTRENESKIAKLEKDLKKSQERNETLNRLSTTNPEISRENEQLKLRIGQCEAREIRLNEQYAKIKTNFNEDRIKFSERISEMGRNLRRIHESNLKLQSENEARSRKIEELMGRLARFENGETPRRSSIFSSFSEYQPPHHPIVTILPIGAERAANRQNRMMATSSSSSLSLSLIPQQSSSATSSSSHPVLQMTPPEIENNSELADVECVICLAEMASEDPTIKCNDCRRRFHSKCASNWLKVKSICPTCKGKLLDPVEFPAL